MPLSTILLLDIGTVLTVWYFFFFILFHPWSYYINMLRINDNPVDGDSHDIFIFFGPI